MKTASDFPDWCFTFHAGSRLSAADAGYGLISIQKPVFTVFATRGRNPSAGPSLFAADESLMEAWRMIVEKIEAGQ